MRILPLVFSASLFGSALLSFSIQPILGKMLLPLIGGAPAGWIVAMAFFQLALLAGYGFSWLLGRFNPWVHALGLLVLYAVGIGFLPPQLNMADDIGAMQGAGLSLAVVRVLAETVLVPFLALTATTSALQRVFAATGHKTAHDPYYLFVASNTGSLIGLFAYPFVLEPLFGLTQQAQNWAYVYGIVIVMLMLSCATAWHYRDKKRTAEQTTEKSGDKIPLQEILYWIILAFVPCSLSMGVTTMITTDMPGIPLLWILPLGLYLLTFILAFAKRQVFSQRRLWAWQLNATGCLFLILVIGTLWGIGFKPTGDLLLYAAFSLLLLEVFFVTSWACHAQLAARRPSVDKLAFYYFILALGGSLAGLFHAFVLPFVTTDIWEFPVMVIASLLLVPATFGLLQKYNPLEKYKPFLTALSCVAAGAVFFQLADKNSLWHMLILICFVIPYVLISGRPRYLFAAAVVIFACVAVTRYHGTVHMTGRNFFGVFAVYDQQTEQGMIRYFSHGNTIHGMEPVDTKDDKTRFYSAYYARHNPIADVLALTRAQTWGVVGLGSGQLACFDPAMVTDFYEIDPDVQDIAMQYFRYLHDCPPREIIIGDGLLELEKQQNKYDVLLLDAFTSDGIPMHLLTVEALRKYMDKLNPDGVMLFHISNRYLNLAPPLAASAQAHGLQAFVITHQTDKNYPLMLASRWLAVPLNDMAGDRLAAKGWEQVIPAARPWTDGRSSLLEAVQPVRTGH